MSDDLRIQQHAAGAFTIGVGQAQPLWRYVYEPETPEGESPRPYVHPLYSSSGDVVTCFRPNDHPWHHGLSFTLTNLDGVNFWGGPTYRAGEGYRWVANHGVQAHRGWVEFQPERMVQMLEWMNPRNGEVLLHETRTLETSVRSDAWTLRWRSELRNAASRDLPLGNYHATEGLAGSHYTGLQFRGARGLLDDHGDNTIGLTSEGGRAGEAAVHGECARWMEWRVQSDGSLRRTRVRFENLDGPIPWFVRRALPLAAFAFHREKPQVLTRGELRVFAHRLEFANL